MVSKQTSMYLLSKLITVCSPILGHGKTTLAEINLCSRASNPTSRTRRMFRKSKRERELNTIETFSGYINFVF